MTSYGRNSIINYAPSLMDTNHIVPAPSCLEDAGLPRARKLEDDGTKVPILYQTPFYCCLSVHELVHTFAVNHNIDVSSLLEGLTSLVHYHAVLLHDTFAEKVVRKRRRRRKRVNASDFDYRTQTSQSVTPVSAPIVETMATPSSDATLAPKSPSNSRFATKNCSAAFSENDSDEEVESFTSMPAPIVEAKKVVTILPKAIVETITPSQSHVVETEKATHSMPDMVVKAIAPMPAPIAETMQAEFSVPGKTVATLCHIPSTQADHHDTATILPDVSISAATHSTQLVASSGTVGSSPSGRGKGRSSGVPIDSSCWLPVFDPYDNRLLTCQSQSDKVYIATKPAEAGSSPGLAVRSQPKFNAMHPSGKYVPWNSTIVGSLAGKWLLIDTSHVASLP